MVVKLMKWRQRPSKKFEAKITVRRLKGLSHVPDASKISVEIKWKGSQSKSLTSLRRGVRRNFTKEESLVDGVVQWDHEEFHCVCSLSCSKDGLFHPWEVSFTVFSGLKQQRMNSVSLLATACLNLAEYALSSKRESNEIDIPMVVSSESIDNSVSLNLSVTLREIRNSEEPLESTPRPMIISFPRSPCYGEMFMSKNDQKVTSTHKPIPSPKRVNILKGLSVLRGRRTGRVEESSDGKSSRSEDLDLSYPPDTDSLDGSHEQDSEGEVTEDSNIRKSLSYRSLAWVNHIRDLNTSSSEDEDWVYYSHCRSDVNVSASESLSEQYSKRSLLPWRKRKLSFRSPKEKGEPLLKKYYGEEGGDDIDFDRRQLSSSDESNVTLKPGEDLVSDQSSKSVFGDDDDFAVGIWERKEITDRDARMKLKTRAFFASIDQRSESACTALVAVIADWFNSNSSHMPIKSQIDSLIREGSLQWRKLCENETYMERFPDKHFDLETVLEAKVRPLSLVPEKSFIGFFQLDGLEHEGFDFLRGAMSFDDIWDEISPSGGSNDPMVYIVSWNDHFFVLKVDPDAYYIIDTLGERLYEGCNQAFILKFDRETIIERISSEAKSDDEPKDDDDDDDDKANSIEMIEGKSEEADDSLIICSGKESCKEYIKSFLASIPIRELQTDVSKGLVNASTPLHHRLQIEFHYTRLMRNGGEFSDI